MRVRVLSPGRPIADLEASSVSLPTYDGYVEILPQHADYVAELGIGQLVIKSNDGTHSYFLAGGFVEVSSGNVMILADTVEVPHLIDLSRATEAQKRAAERLTQKDPRLDVGRALQALRRAQERISVARHSGGGQ
jgi:F-type H+-transporting ATPase subunit epsilon